MFIYLNKKAQSTAEYVIVLGLIVGAVVAMQTFVKRGLQDRLKKATEYSDPEAAVVFGGRIEQYDPYYLESHFDTTSRTNESEAIATGGGDVTRNTTEEFSNRTGNQIIHNAQ
ncbi:MAG: hypothetical protein PHT41_08225 [Candidatus Omnitrophica bacterium]|nr:hypothetical protein [Candidatus Omnitrophota bacterium]MDD5238306.1 hypothetical protein [Candidatus Omnitrophota bacterium]